MNSYFSIEAPSEGWVEDKGSKFLAYSFPVNQEQDIKSCLLQIKTLHPKATHHCYAYRLGLDKNNYRANDDGEPSGSAGRPILGQIDSFKLSNVLLIVVRYYGGTNLGVSGLISAYKKAAAAALQNATIIEKEVMLPIQITCSYLHVNDLFNFLKRNGIEQWQESYEDDCKITFSYPKSFSNSLSLFLDDHKNAYTRADEEKAS